MGVFMNKKLFILLSSLFLFTASSVFAAPKISGKKYVVTNVNGQDMTAYTSILTMYISFTDDYLTMTISSMGQSEDMSEKYEYNTKTGILKEYTLEGSVVTYTISEITDGIRMTSADGTSVMDLIETSKFTNDNSMDFLELLNSLSDDVDEANQWLQENSSDSSEGFDFSNWFEEDDEDEEEFDFSDYF